MNHKAVTKTIIASMMLLVSGPVAANQAATVSLDSCRAMALRSNKQMRIQSEKQRVAHYQHREALAAYLPAIDFAGGYIYNQKELSVFGSDQHLPVGTFDLQTQSYQYDVVKNPMTGQPVVVDGTPIPTQTALIPKESMTFDIHNVFFGAVTLTQPIYMGGKIMAMNRITHFAEEAARYLRDNEACNVIYAVDGAYWQVVSLKAKQKLCTAYVELLDTLRHNVEAMLAQGVCTRSDLLTVEVKLNQARVDMVKVDNGLSLSRMALAQVCGLPVDTELQLADEDSHSMPALMPVAPAGDMNQVYARRPDLLALETAVKVMEQKERLALSSMLPNVALVGAYTFSNPNMFDGFSKRFTGAFSVGAMVTIPIWHWGGNISKYRAAKAQTVISRLEAENARELIDLQVNQSVFKAREAAKTYEMTLANMDKANENLRQAQLGFHEGVMTADNVMEAQTAWLKANSERIDAMIDVHLCDVYLAKVTGQLTLALDPDLR